MLKFAGRLAPLLRKAWPAARAAGNLMVPGGANTPKELAVHLGMSLVPNALYAGMAGATLPENAGFGDRIMAGGENFLGSTALELGTQALAGGGLRLAGSRVGPLGQMALRSGIAMAAPMVAYSSGLIPQPTTQRVWSDHNDQMQQQMAAEANERDRAIAAAAREQAFAEMAGFGGMPRQAYLGMYGPGGIG